MYQPNRERILKERKKVNEFRMNLFLVTMKIDPPSLLDRSQQTTRCSFLLLIAARCSGRNTNTELSM
jgi:hypothetical protein